MKVKKGIPAILQHVAACRGALNGLMAGIIEGHVFMHVLEPNQPHTAEQHQAAEELMDVVRASLK